MSLHADDQRTCFAYYYGQDALDVALYRNSSLETERRRSTWIWDFGQIDHKLQFVIRRGERNNSFITAGPNLVQIGAMQTSYSQFSELTFIVRIYTSPVSVVYRYTSISVDADLSDTRK